MIPEFFFSSTPHIHFGSGKRSMLTELAGRFGKKMVLVTGDSSFDSSGRCQQLWQELSRNFEIRRVRVSGEPSPQLVDKAVAEHHNFSADCVVAIGGGSAVDAGKAIAGLLPGGESVMEYLEGVGKGKAYAGPSTPLIAIPTTAGTGGETSRNAVLSVVGEKGFKKSFRHEALVARYIILDPELTLDCPAELTAACGMDALTQLLESYVSSAANPMTDALAISGLERVRDSLLTAVEDGDDINARTGMLYASSLSGLTLANAGLGSVHGLASPLGALFPIPHGVVCGTLLFEATQINITAMYQRVPDHPSLEKYADAGRLFTRQASLDSYAAREALLGILQAWSGRLMMPRLSRFGVSEEDIDRIVAGSRGNSMQTNPVRLTDQEIAGIVRRRL
ncbi:MAG: iron-containing alcohol dehydrogenase [Mariprofundaceae bacterium]|nr:iron-containing alcohol dehydrogenase [Mariprofundaceae bacterium]